ncbi:hypothetical protein IHN32_14175, partial [Deinococcus sp. 14RED07]|nr:hypothetical protein [Deinococcus sp. 14RED07]
MFHERHQHALDRQAQLIREAQADGLTRALRATRPCRWQFRWRLMRLTLHLPVLHV